MAPSLTAQRVEAAYGALASGEAPQVATYWDEDMRWLVPGNHALAGWYEGRDAFLGFMHRVAELSGNSFVMTPITILVNDQYSADVTHNFGMRNGAGSGSSSPYERLDIDVIHLLRWHDGRVVEGRGAIFGDGTVNFNQFWSPIGTTGARSDG